MANSEFSAFEFTPKEGLRNKNVFPARPATEDEARGQFMELFDQLADYTNALVTRLKEQGVI